MQFWAGTSVHLYWAILACVSGILVVYGVWQLSRSRLRRGLVSIAAAGGAIAPALLIDGVVGRRRGRRGGGAAGVLACGVATAGTAAVLLVIVYFRDLSQAVWLSVLAFQVAAAVGVLYAAVYAYLGPGRIAALMALRCGAIMALMLILFKPALQFTPRRFRPVLSVLVDSSGSMSVRDAARRSIHDAAKRPLTRYERAMGGLRGQWERLDEHFKIEWGHFGDEFSPVRLFEELADVTIDDATEGTNIALAIEKAVDGRSRGELAGMLLISDGIHNAKRELGEALFAAAGAKVRIYTAGIGSLDEPKAGPGIRNIQIVSVDAPDSAIRNNVTTLNVRVRMKGMKQRPAELHVTEATGGAAPKVFPIRVEKDDETTTVKVPWRPADSATTQPMGAARSEVRRLRFSVPAVAGEATGDDNAADLHVLVTQPRIRVLYIEGHIRPEYKFLKLRLGKDPNVQFLGMVRVKGSEFWSYGSIDGQRLEQLPLTDRDFGLFDVLILGDLDSSFLRPQRMARIRKFVNDGGGLVMLGGHYSFGPGGYGGTDIEAVLPVNVGPRTQPQETTEFLPQLTAAGEDHPIFEGFVDSLPAPGRRDPKPDAVPLRDLLGCVTVVGPKPGAEVLAVHPTRRNQGGPLVVLATQKFGKGRTVALTADTTWRWYAPMRSAGADGPYQRLWAQTVRWSAHVDTKTREASPSVVLRQDRAYLPAGKEVRLRASVRGIEDSAGGQAEVRLAVLDARGTTVYTRQLTSTSDVGTYEGTYRADKAGKFTLKAWVADKTGGTLCQDELPLAVASHSAETEQTARNTETLAKIANKSGGQNADIKHLPKLVDSIIERHRKENPTPRPRIVKLYYFLDYLLGYARDKPHSVDDPADDESTGFTALFLILVALLTAEWMLRRHWQLH